MICLGAMLMGLFLMLVGALVYFFMLPEEKPGLVIFVIGAILQAISNFAIGAKMLWFLRDMFGF